MEYYVPHTIVDAVEKAAGKTSTSFIAGGTDLSLMLYDGIRHPDTLIDISAVEDMTGVNRSGELLTLGAAVTMKDLAGCPDVPACLSRGAALLGSPQIRSVATLGGNICNASPCGDTLPGLLVLNAELLLRSASGERTVSAEDFFTGPKSTVLRPGEMLVSVTCSAENIRGHSGFSKIGKRRGQVISQANAAVWFRVEDSGIIGDIRIAVGSVAPVPMRLGEMEDYLRGKALDGSLKDYIRRTAGSMVSPISDVRASEWYRRDIIGSLIVDALETATEGGRI